MKTKIKQISNVILGLLLAAISFNLFLSPNNIVSGGLEGLAIIFHHIFNFNESIFMLVINIFLIILSYTILGKKRTIYTILGAILYPFLIELTRNITTLININDLEPLLFALLGGALSGTGLGLVYKNGFSTGGTDIIDQIIEQKIKIPMSQAILYVDGFIVFLSAIVFGIENMIYSIIALVTLSYISNKVMLNIGQNKVFYIYTSKPKEIKAYLSEKYAYDLTIFDTVGGFTKRRNKLFMCSILTKDYYAIKEGILLIDPNAFVIITKAYEEKNANAKLRASKKLTLDRI